MKRSLALAALLLAAAAPSALAWQEKVERLCESPRNEPLQPLPVHIELDQEKVALGAQLFHDPRLSADDSISCASCHVLALAGSDGRPRSPGVGGQLGDRNSPSVFNRSFDFRMFWDGRAADLLEQVDGPLHNPIEMASNWPAVIAKLERDQAFVNRFRKRYPDGLKPENLRDAIVTFERSLFTPRAPLDRYLCGDDHALSTAQRQGYELFKQYGCVACHQGQNVGGNMFQRIGVMRDFFADRGGAKPSDMGRFNVTGRESDRFVFKVPSLRNVALTAPYFHDGSAKDLETAIRVMARYQLGREMPGADVDRIAAFLDSLTGAYVPAAPAP